MKLYTGLNGIVISVTNRPAFYRMSGFENSRLVIHRCTLYAVQSLFNYLKVNRIRLQVFDIEDNLNSKSTRYEERCKHNWPTVS